MEGGSEYSKSLFNWILTVNFYLTIDPLGKSERRERGNNLFSGQKLEVKKNSWNDWRSHFLRVKESRIDIH